MPAGGRALIPKTPLGGLPFVGFYTSAPSRCIRGMNGGAVPLSFFLISIFLFSKFREADGHALIPKNAFGWPSLCGFLHLRPIPLHSRDERWSCSPLLFSNFHFSIFQV